MRGCFGSDRFRFQVEDSDWASDSARGFHAHFEDDFGLLPTRTGRVPDLGGPPLASWLLARLARLTDIYLGLDDREDTDGGGYVNEFVVYRAYIGPAADPAQQFLFNLAEFERPAEPEHPITSFQFQADMEGAGVVGRRAPDCP